jgi:acetyl esterase/lipase
MLARMAPRGAGDRGEPIDIVGVAPALREPLTQQPALDLERWWVRDLAALRARLIPWTPTPDVVLSTVREGGVRLRVYTPDRSTGAALLWIHGGGLIGDAARVDDRFCGRTALDLGVTVVSVDHRLAPRHPFPAALDDAHAGWAWLQVRAPILGIERTRIAVGGRSSGGGVAASLVQRLRDEDDEDAAAQWLWSPMLDDRTAADRSLDAIGHPAWSNRANRVGWTASLGGPPGEASPPPYAVPARRTDLTGLPPAWICTSDLALFHDEDVAYARALEAAGVETTLDVVKGAPHGFEAWAPDTPPARALLRRGRDWLARQLA